MRRWCVQLTRRLWRAWTHTRRLLLTLLFPPHFPRVHCGMFLQMQLEYLKDRMRALGGGTETTLVNLGKVKVGQAAMGAVQRYNKVWRHQRGRAMIDWLVVD